MTLGISASVTASVGGAAGSAGSSTGELAKAKLEVISSVNDPKKGLKPGGPNGQTIAFTFNPNQLSFTRTVSWDVKPTPSKGAPVQFISSQPVAMTVEMFLDASEGGTVREQVEAVLKLTDAPEGKAPDFVRLRWGEMSYLVSMVTSVAVTYSRFDRNGQPIRATVNITLQEYRPKQEATNPSSGGEQALEAHVLTVGETLAGVAQRELGDPGQWRTLAEFNGIDDPLRLRPGTTVLIPARVNGAGSSR